MIRSLFIKLITIVVMATHSLFGCGFHHACNTCCGEEVSGCDSCCSCQSDCCENNQACSFQQSEITSNCCLYSEVDEESSHHNNSPAKEPCHCKCEHSDCVFLHDNSTHCALDGISHPPVTLCLNQFVCTQTEGSFWGLQTEFDSLGKTGVSGFAMIQVWLI